MCYLNSFINFDEFEEFNLISQTKFTKIVTSKKYFSPSQKYIFKIFQFECNSEKEQRIILETFYNISNKKSQYLQSYDHLSFFYKTEFQPTFSMKYIQSKTLEQVLKTPDLFANLKIENIMKCLFAVAEGMSYLHSHLVYHGNLCPSNIIIDEANQFYLCDFGLYPIKRIYIKEEELFNQDYKDPYMKNNQPTFSNDIYSFGVLMCEICMTQLKISNKIKKEETLKNFLQNSNENKFDSFPPFYAELISSCLNSFTSERPSFGQILNIFKSKNKKAFGIDIQKLYEEFSNSNYLFTLAEKNDSNALNKIGEMYEKGEIFERNDQKALEFYEKAALLNNSEAQNNLGVLLQKNSDKNKSVLVKSAKYLRLSAEHGNIYGMANYAIALLNGDGVEQNFQKAEEYLHKSADLGNSNAQLYYGNLLLSNNPSMSAINEGLAYIKKAINQKNPDAYFTLGTLFRNGKFVEKNDNLAMENFKIAADMGHGEAILEYANGIMKSSPENEKIALKYYQIAFDKGNKKVKGKIDELQKKLKEPKIIEKEIIDENVEAVPSNNNSNNNNSNNLENNIRNPKSKQKGHFEHFDESSEDDDEYRTPKRNVIYRTRNTKKSSNSKSSSQPAFVMSKNEYKNIKQNLRKEIPVKINPKINLISLGSIVYDRSSFHTNNYLYPVGYTAEREYNSIANPEQMVMYRCSVLDGRDCPIFRVECLDESKKVFEGFTPSHPWREVRAAVEKAKNSSKRSRDIGISGPFYYGFGYDTIIYLVERLPNANKCDKYQFKTFPSKKVDSDGEEQNKEEIEQNDEDNVDHKEEEGEQKDEEKVDRKEDEVEQKDEEKFDDDDDDEVEQKDEEKSDDKEKVDDEDDVVEQKDEVDYKEEKEEQKDDDEIVDNSKENEETMSQPHYSNSVLSSNENIIVITGQSSDDNDDDDNYDEDENYLNLPLDDLIQQGDSFLDDNDFIRAEKCYKEAINMGRKDVLLKYAEISESFDRKLEILEQAVHENVPNAFSKWRLSIMKRICLIKNKSEFAGFAKKFEEYEDYSDAAVVYFKDRDFKNFKVCYAKAIKGINEITDGYQQYDFALLLIRKKEKDLAKMMLQRAAENGIEQAESKLRKIILD